MPFQQTHTSGCKLKHIKYFKGVFQMGSFNFLYIIQKVSEPIYKYTYLFIYICIYLLIKRQHYYTHLVKALKKWKKNTQHICLNKYVRKIWKKNNTTNIDVEIEQHWPGHLIKAEPLGWCSPHRGYVRQVASRLECSHRLIDALKLFCGLEMCNIQSARWKYVKIQIRKVWHSKT